MSHVEQEPCVEKRLLIQAEIDGELSAAEAAQITAHREGCPTCSATHAALLALHREIRQTLVRHEAPASLRQRIEGNLARHQSSQLAMNKVADPVVPFRRPQPWRRIGMGFGAGALAMAASLLLLLHSPTSDTADLVVAGHIRALQPGHLMDVVSTDQHNVKPWFDGRLDFAPPVRNLAGIGFPLEGGRLDYLQGRAVAALVYKVRQHIINLYVWPSPNEAVSEPQLKVLNGYNMYHWTEGGMTLWAVSDVNAADLGSFVHNWRSK